MTRYRDAVFAATHNSYSGRSRGSLHEQLDRGVRCLEIDLAPSLTAEIEVGHLVPGVDVSDVGENPEEFTLEPWLRGLLFWCAEHPGHSPVTLVFDIKPLALGSGGERSTLTDFLDLVEHVFGERLLHPDEQAGVATDLELLRNRVLVVVSGEVTRRERLLRDPGHGPRIGVDGAGRVLEVHQSRSSGELWWWTGRIASGRIAGIAHDKIRTNAVAPELAVAPDGRLVMIYSPHSSHQTRPQVWVQTGHLDRHGRPVFHRPRRLGWGSAPEVQWRDDAFLATYRSNTQGERVVRAGRPAARGFGVDWEPSRPADDTPAPAPARLADGTPLAVTVDHDGILRWCLGDGPFRRIRYERRAWVEHQPQDPEWMADLELEFCACPAAQPAWGLARRAEGRVVRLWKVEPQTLPATPVNFPATDTPYAAWYRQYLQDVGGEV